MAYNLDNERKNSLWAPGPGGWEYRMEQKPILVVMAAGMGSRYGGLKQIDPVGPAGEAILDYSLYDAARAGFGRVVFVIKKEIEAEFRRTVGARAEKSGLEVRYAFQRLDDLPEGYSLPEGRVKPWGTAQAVLAARGEIDRPFAVINADDSYGPRCFEEMARYLANARDGEQYQYAMVGFLLKNTVSENGYVSRGVCEEDGEGYLRTVTERTRIESGTEGIRFSPDGGESWQPLDPDSVVSMNLWGFTPSFLTETGERFAAFLEKALQTDPLKAEYFLPGVVSQLIEEGKARVKVLRSPDKWYGVTYQADRPLVAAALAEKTREGQYPSPLWQ